MKINAKHYVTMAVSFLIILTVLVMTNASVSAQTRGMSEERVSAARLAIDLMNSQTGPTAEEIEVIRQEAYANIVNHIQKIQDMPIDQKDIKRITRFLPKKISSKIEKSIAISKSDISMDAKVNAILETFESSNCTQYVAAAVVADVVWYFLCGSNPYTCITSGFYRLVNLFDDIGYFAWAAAVLCYLGVI